MPELPEVETIKNELSPHVVGRCVTGVTLFWEGMVRAFAFFGGVPRRITFDNEGILVAAVLGAHGRKVTRGFLELQSHYLFEEHFCRVYRANEKGVVEGTVKYARLNFFVPVPQVRDLEELNAALRRRCTEDLQRTLRGKGLSKAGLLEEDRAMFLPLPAAPFDACRKVSTFASSLSLVRFDRNDYSVPVRYAHHPVVVKGYVERVEVCHREEEVAEHGRLWGKEGVSFDPVHYVALLERKPGALDHARPLEDWDLPEDFDVLRRRLEAEGAAEGTREYIRVLRLLETHSLRDLERAVARGLRRGALTRDAIAQFFLPPEEPRAPTFRLDGREHAKLAAVCQAERADYATYLLRLAEREVQDREVRAAERRVRAARFPVLKTLDTFDFAAQPSINQALVRELARGEYMDHRENVLLIGNSGTGKTHLATALAFAACQQGRRVRFFSVTGLVTQLLERREERQLERFHQQLERHDLLVLDELGYVPCTKAGAELLFEVVSRAYERTSLLVTTNLPFESWTEILGTERLTGALLDRLTHRIHILEANGESYRLRESRRRLRRRPAARANQAGT